MAIEAARQDQQALTELSRAEAERIEALEKLESMKRRAETKLASTSSTELKSELDRMRLEFASLSKPPGAAPATVSGSGPTAVGPSFNCAGARTPLQRVICADPDLRRLDIQLLQPAYVLRHAVPATRDQVRDEGVALSRRVEEKCDLGENSKVTAARLKLAIPCVTAEYRKQTQAWRQQVARKAPGAGGEEAARPVDEHVRLHELLKSVGVLPTADRADGVYGAVTRTAIAELQRSEGLPADGLMSGVTVERLLRRSGTRNSSVTASIRVDSTRRTQIAELQRRYETLVARSEEFDAEQNRRAQLKAKVAAARRAAEDARQAPVRPELRDRADAFIRIVDELGPDATNERLSRVAAEFDSLRGPLESSVAIARATTSKNSFVTEGDLADVILLFNDTGKAPSVIKNLRGDIVFEGQKILACQAHKDPIDPAFARELNRSLRKWNQQLMFPLPRCAAAGLAGNDLVVFARGAVLERVVFRPRDYSFGRR